jgi:hypothetical protein
MGAWPCRMHKTKHNVTATWRTSTVAERPIIKLLAEVATIFTQSALDRHPAGVRDADVADRDLAVASLAGLASCCCKPSAAEAG